MPEPRGDARPRERKDRRELAAHLRERRGPVVRKPAAPPVVKAPR